MAQLQSARIRHVQDSRLLFDNIDGSCALTAVLQQTLDIGPSDILAASFRTQVGTVYDVGSNAILAAVPTVDGCKKAHSMASA